MEFKAGTSVYTADGQEVGRVDRVILNPQTNEVAGIVVRKGFLFAQDKVVPMFMVFQASNDQVTLRQGLGVDTDLKKLADFEEAHYVPIDGNPGANTSSLVGAPAMGAFPLSLYWYPPVGLSSAAAGGYGNPLPGYSVETNQNIPDNTVALQEGARIVSGDNQHVGNLERVLVDAQNGKATHLLISQGIFLKDRKAVPVSWVRKADESEIQLTVTAEVLNSLPAYQEASKEGFHPGVF